MEIREGLELACGSEGLVLGIVQVLLEHRHRLHLHDAIFYGEIVGVDGIGVDFLRKCRTVDTDDEIIQGQERVGGVSCLIPELAYVLVENGRHVSVLRRHGNPAFVEVCRVLENAVSLLQVHGLL